MQSLFTMCVRYALVLLSLGFFELHAQNVPKSADPLSFTFDKHYGQVEVGGPYAGAEFHGSRPLPARISFFYPVANSIDLSTDYWKRDASQPWVIGIRRDNGERQWLGKNPWTYTLSPHRVSFSSSDRHLSYRITYEFCLNQPAMVQTLVIRNSSRRPSSVEVYTHLRTMLRTCQTYARKDSAWTEYDAARLAIITNYDDADAARAVGDLEWRSAVGRNRPEVGRTFPVRGEEDFPLRHPVELVDVLAIHGEDRQAMPGEGLGDTVARQIFAGVTRDGDVVVVRLAAVEIGRDIVLAGALRVEVDEQHGLRRSDYIESTGMSEMKVAYDDLNRTAYGLARGISVHGTHSSVIGGFSAVPEGAAMVSVAASLQLVAVHKSDSFRCGAVDSRIKSRVTRGQLWVAGTAIQFFEYLAREVVEKSLRCAEGLGAGRQR